MQGLWSESHLKYVKFYSYVIKNYKNAENLGYESY